MKKDKSKTLFWLVIAGLGLVAAFVLIPVPQQKSHPSHANPHSQDLASLKSPDQLVNKHLWLTNKAQELAQDRMKAQNQFTNPQVGDSIWPKGQNPEKQKNLGVDHSPDTNETNVYDDLNRYPKQLEVQSPDHVIQAQLSDEQRRREYEEAYRAEYARQFVENARRNGYEIKLNDQFVVISVKPIRNPTSFDLGPQAK